MMKGSWFIFFFLFSLGSLIAQQSVSFTVKDSLNHEAITGAVVKLDLSHASATDMNGNAILKNIAAGEQVFEVSYLGYFTKKLKLNLVSGDTLSMLTVLLVPEETGLEEVIVSTTRTNSRIDDLPVKVEVLGEEDMNEESTIVPGNVASLLGDLAIITIQRTNQVNGNDAIRMQGLDPKYTQIMRDGLPLFGGFSGSLGVLSIPPLDLKQVEIIKGSASTLYGGGAIGGLINFISKTPSDTPKATISINASSLGETNFNSFISKKKNRTGLTLFTGANLKQAVDINGDGFTEVPLNRNFSFHPRLFFDLSKNTKLAIGLTSIYDSREGGDIKAIRSRPDTIHNFIQVEKTFRNTLDVLLTRELGSRHFLTLKTAGSAYQRNVDYSGFLFNGTQYSSYSEVNDVIRLARHTLVAGLNVMSEAFVLGTSDASAFKNYAYSTIGSFFQDDWQVTRKLSLQFGIRFDHHSAFGNFPLPRLSLFYKAGSKLSFRLAAGSGYKIPNVFDLATPSVNLTNIRTGIKPENSYGINADINYRTVLFEKVNVQFNQAFYYSYIQNPVVLGTDSLNRIVMRNGIYYVNSYGSDSYLRFKYKDAELYLGYNHTESLQQYDNGYVYMPFNPRDKLSFTFAYDIEGKWRLGAEAAYTANQYIYGNKAVKNFWFFAAMVEKKFRLGSIVLNCENLLDFRQSRVENLVVGTYANPVFRPVWGPIEGRVVNLSVRLNL
ncbi:MAG: TonB-dependent receptor domain-containing protein [Bacteroidia bacterium]